ncbi:MAG TPA: ABC transporter permease [Bacteroidales bacterium]|jgi:putative ABC transport system permease protein|nr:ABC transporter permease [Bacteroidales bacterium]
MDYLQEIFATLRKNKLRTTLTGLSVSWGIFILIVLLGASNGLKNGVTANFEHRAVNRINMWTGITSMPYQGLKSGRNLKFSEQEISVVEDKIKESRLVTARSNRTQNISYGTEYGSYQINGVMPSYAEMEKLVFEPGNGRFFNHLDYTQRSKVIVIDKQMAEVLFKEKSPLGEYVKVGQLMFKVIGVNSKKEQWGGPVAYIPFSTMQVVFNTDKKFYQLSFTVEGLETTAENERFNKSLRNLMGRQLKFDPEDSQALWVNNSQSDYIETMKIFSGVNLFVTIVGILTLIAGIVGVSNIMLVSVKERTREIGIRKAIGAPPASILTSIILESIIITAIFGYIGMFLGIGVTEIMNFITEQAANVAQSADGGPQMSVFKNPTVNIGYAIFATVLLVISGVIAGYLPARKAVKIKPIEAMRQE